jgi:predicted signal transduction protein with EAL and GGDEF domain
LRCSKVDRAFVSDLSERNEHIVIVQAVVSIARAWTLTLRQRCNPKDVLAV